MKTSRLTPRQFSAGFKQAMVLLQSGDPARRTICAFAKAYGIHRESLYLWVRQAKAGILNTDNAIAFTRLPSVISRLPQATGV